jgi:hypothetical protein
MLQRKLHNNYFKKSNHQKMCKYSILSQREYAVIRYCHHCKIYSITYNNLIMNFDVIGFDGFKNSLANCYRSNIEDHFPEHRDVRDVTFGTRLDGLQFLFSINEIGMMLALILYEPPFTG